MNIMNHSQTTSLIQDYAVERRELIATNYFGLASFIMLVYDHALTFDDEVQYVWRGNKKIVSWLFLVNRYVTPLGFMVNINAYLSPVWTPTVCANFVRFEGSMTLIGISIASLMMGVRVIAIYHGTRLVPVVVSTLFLIMVGVNAWLLTAGEPVHHPTGIHGCSMIFGPKIGSWGAASAWVPLLYDTVIVALVVYRTKSIVRAKIAGQFHVVSTLMRDGIMYYSVILGANLVLAIMIEKSSEGVKNIFAQFQLLITVTMMSRITLNLRKNMQRSPALHDQNMIGADSIVLPTTNSDLESRQFSTYRSSRPLSGEQLRRWKERMEERDIIGLESVRESGDPRDPNDVAEQRSER